MRTSRFPVGDYPIQCLDAKGGTSKLGYLEVKKNGIVFIRSQHETHGYRVVISRGDELSVPFLLLKQVAGHPIEFKLSLVKGTFQVSASGHELGDSDEWQIEALNCPWKFDGGTLEVSSELKIVLDWLLIACPAVA